MSWLMISKFQVGERIGLCGTSGRKFSGIRSHLEHLISDKYNGISVACDTFPEDSVERDTTAYKQAMDSFNMGDIVVIFTPDDTHYDVGLAQSIRTNRCSLPILSQIAMEAISRGMHVMLTKPPVKTLKQHRTLVEAAKRHNVLVTVEVHKRFDAIYSDARQRIRQLGDFGFFQSYMSQPKHQLGIRLTTNSLSTDTQSLYCRDIQKLGWKELRHFLCRLNDLRFSIPSPDLFYSEVS